MPGDRLAEDALRFAGGPCSRASPSEAHRVPLYLINWKEATHGHSRTQNNPWLLEIKPENPLVIHPDTARKYGMKDGDKVKIESLHGKTEGTAKVSLRMHPEVVGLQHGFGHWALGKGANGRGTADGSLRPTESDPLSGQALHKEACVPDLEGVALHAAVSTGWGREAVLTGPPPVVAARSPSRTVQPAPKATEGAAAYFRGVTGAGEARLSP